MAMTLDQKRANFAWNKITNDVVSKAFATDYKNLAKSLPALVMSNGLLQTLSFLKGKDKKSHDKILEHLLTWLNSSLSITDDNSFDGMVAALTSQDQDGGVNYWIVTEEALEFMRWLRYLAAAAI